MKPHDVTHFTTQGEFRAWLQKHHDSADVLWVGYWKKATGRPSVTWEETVDVALCFGWIDGIRQRVDEATYTIRFTPRRPTSVWSHRNVGRFEAMVDAGLMTKAGQAAFEQGREARTGASYDPDEPPGLSEEYLAQLRANPEAWRDWESRPPGYRRLAAHWVMSAKREDTRQRRLASLIEDAAAGRKVKPLRR